MFGLFKEKEDPLLTVKVNGKDLCVIDKSELPCEKTPSLQLSAGGTLSLVDSTGLSHNHDLGDSGGWFHFSIRVYPNLACQTDCAITSSSVYDQAAFSKGEATGIRFQPFFISGAEVGNEVFLGKGLFQRGLHFSGSVTNGAIALSCECDFCQKSFMIQSFHAGFSNVGYFYSTSGNYTMIVSDQISGCPTVLSAPDVNELAALEKRLPKAPDGSDFKYLNPFRCPHCKRPYVDFEKNPEQRQAEYYGNCYVGKKALHYDEASV